MELHTVSGRAWQISNLFLCRSHRPGFHFSEQFLWGKFALSSTSRGSWVWSDCSYLHPTLCLKVKHKVYFIPINIVITRKDVLISGLSNFIVLGLSDEIRSNFSIMKDLAQHTRISPAGRAKELESFMNDLQTNQEAQKEMSQWNLNFERTLLKMTGRTYPPESKSFVVG